MSLDMGITILVVDDSGAMCMLLKEMLGKIGYKKIVTAVDGDEAYGKLQEQTIDLVISDWEMPKLDGPSLLKQIRENTKNKDVPFILSVDRDNKAQEGLAKKMQDIKYIFKPFDAIELEKKITEVFSGVQENNDLEILAVDDSSAMRAMLQNMLNEAGFNTVILAEDGRDAIEKLEKNSVGLIISDWNMPNMDGLELLKWVRASKEYKDIPVIMATAQGDKTQEETIVREKGNGHIAKPFDTEQIKEKINEVLGLKKEGKTEKRVPKIIKGKVQIKLGHIQITDHLALGVLKHQIDTGSVTPKYFELETSCMPGWNPIQKSLEQGDIDGAFVLAPIAMDLFAFGVPIKLVSFAHKNGSSLVRNKNYADSGLDSLTDFYKNKIVNIPHKMSIHNMLADMFLRELGLSPGVSGNKNINVNFEVVPPVKMPGIMKDDAAIAGFIVAEPIASNAIAKGIADMEFRSAKLWKDHPCCVVTMRDDFISEYGDAVYELVSLLVQAGKFVDENKSKAAEIAVAFLDPEKKLGLTTEVLKKVLEDPEGITMGDLYPVPEDLDRIQRYMFDEMSIGKLMDVEKFIDFTFVDAAVK